MLPEFNEDGILPPGLHSCTGNQFLERFVSGKARSNFYNAVVNTIDFAAARGATSILVGGSFITNKESPHDFDCVIVFKTRTQIPLRHEDIDISGSSVDIYFASEDQPEVLASFVKLFSTNRFDLTVGAVAIVLRTSEGLIWNTKWDHDPKIYEIVKRAYIGRHYVDRNRRDKVLVTIHGIRTYADWNAEVTLIASGNGWMVAPFQYGFTQPTVFARTEERNSIVDSFRDFLATITKMFDIRDISVIAHSFGSYIALRYLTGFQNPPTKFDTLILTGAILDCDLDIESLRYKVGHIFNDIAPNDEWVEWAKTANFAQDKLFGYAGTRGFTQTSDLLAQETSEIFTHTNVIRRDTVAQRWMPILEANVGSVSRDIRNKFIREIKEEYPRKRP